MAASWANKNPSRKSAKPEEHKSTALFLQGGGALGAYQAGAYKAMAEAGIEPDWVSGISIGAINGAIIAGNPPEQRAAKLEAFWKHIDTGFSGSASAATKGVKGFFTPEPMAVFNENLRSFGLMGFGHQTALYDPSAMYDTLKKFVDFDYLNDKSNVRLSVGAVNVENGELVYYDSRQNITLEEGLKTRAKDSIMRNTQEVRKRRIGPEHIMASGALLGSFPSVTIEGDDWNDGGHLSNTPIRLASETGQLHKDMQVFRVDLWSRKGRKPDTPLEGFGRAKELQFSSPTIDLTGKVEAHIHTVLSNDGRSFFRDADFSHHAITENMNAGYNDMKAAIIEYKKQRAAQPLGTISVGKGDSTAAVNPADTIKPVRSARSVKATIDAGNGHGFGDKNSASR